MCGPKIKDNSHKVAEANARAAREAREAEAARAAQERADFESRLSGAYNTGISSARDYFTNQGLDANDYLSAITSEANTRRTSVPLLDGSPGTYFADLGSSVYDSLQENERNAALRDINSFGNDGFAARRISDTVDDSFLEQILNNQRLEANDYISRLFDRGVITQSGVNAAQKDLDRQRSSAALRLEDVGLAELERGRGELRDIVSQGRQTASNLNLGDVFDPFEIQGNVDSAQERFFASLGERLSGTAPTDLFDLDGLINIAGAAQGAGNTAFNPSTFIPDINEENEDEDENEQQFMSF